MNIIDQIDAATGCQHCQRPLGTSVSADFCSPACQSAWHAARSEPLIGYREPDDLAAHVSNLVERRSAETTPQRPNDAQGYLADIIDEARRDHEDRARARVDFHVAVPVDRPGNAMLTVEHAGERVRFAVPRDWAAWSTLQTFWQESQHIPQWVATGVPLVRAVAAALTMSELRRRRHEPAAIGVDPATGMVTAMRRAGQHVHAAILDEHHRSQNAFVSPAQAIRRMFEGLRRSAEALRPVAEQLGQTFSTVPAQLEPDNAQRMRAALEARRTRNTGPARAQRAPRRIDPRRDR